MTTKTDPSRTGRIRRAIILQIRKRYKEFNKRINELIVDQDVLGLEEVKPFTFNVAEYWTVMYKITNQDVLNYVGALQGLIEASSIDSDNVQLETEPHITVKYGLELEKAEDVNECVKQFTEPGGVTTYKIKPVKVWSNPTKDVIHIPVDSNYIRGLNKQLGLLPHTTNQNIFTPHITLATTAPGVGERIAMNIVNFMSNYTIDGGLDLVVSSPERKQTQITTNVEPREWEPLTTQQKSDEFAQWMLDNTDISNEGDFWTQYVEEGYVKGAERTWKEAKLKQTLTGVVEDLSSAQELFTLGRDTEFIRGMIGGPETVEKLKLLTGRVLDDLQGVGKQTAVQLKRHLADGLVQGDNPKQIARRISKQLGVSQRHAERIARTEIIRAHAEGQLDAYERMGVVEIGVAVEYRTAGDTRVCPQCAPLNGTVLKIKESHGLIPLHPSCIPGEMRVRAPNLRAVMHSLYTGEIFDFLTSVGNIISFTANHIILTQRGWVKAKDITDRDYFINCPTDIASRGPDKDLGEPRIADVFDSLVEMSDELSIRKSLPMSHDLHGDGVSTDSEISVILVDRILRNQNQSQAIRSFEERLFKMGTVSSVDTLFLMGSSFLNESLNRHSTTTDRLMGSFGIFDVLFSRAISHHQLVSLGLTSDRDVGFNEHSINGASTQTEILRNTKLGDPRRIEFDNLIGGKMVKVESCSTRHVNSYPVYDMSTDSTMYSVNGILTSNCRCSFAPANVGENKKAQKRGKKALKAIKKSRKAGSKKKPVPA